MRKLYNNNNNNTKFNQDIFLRLMGEGDNLLRLIRMGAVWLVIYSRKWIHLRNNKKYVSITNESVLVCNFPCQFFLVIRRQLCMDICRSWDGKTYVSCQLIFIIFNEAVSSTVDFSSYESKFHSNYQITFQIILVLK